MEIINLKKEALEKALKTLYKSIAKISSMNRDNENYENFRDSLIKRFEYCTESLWKYLKTYLNVKFRIPTPRPNALSIYQQSNEADLISFEEYDELVDMTEDRNRTTHAYHEELAEEISKKIPRYYTLMKNILDKTD